MSTPRRIKIPATRPKWSTGGFAVYIETEPQGYFRTFMGAWHWRNYLRQTQPAGTTLTIQHRGTTINIHRIGPAFDGITVKPQGGAR